MRVKYLDVLKAFAIIAVVLYHSGYFTYGYLGVDLFLVINGYLITKSLLSKVLLADTSKRIGYFPFEISRITRLLPPLLVAGLFCMILGFFAMLPDDYENLSQSVIATNFFGNNILSAITTEDYWDVVNEYKPLMHTWYVGVVMQFYIIYPILFYLARLFKKDSKRALLTMISTLAVVSLLIYFGTDNATARFYYLPSRFFEFAMGGIVALVYKPHENKPFSKTYTYICYALLLLLMAVNVEVIPNIVRLVAVVVLSTVLLCSQDILENKVTGNTVLAKIGAASYSIFIWHQIFLAFLRYSVTSHFTVGVYLLYLLAVAVISWLSYRFVENAINNALVTKQGKRIFYPVVAILFVGVTIFAGYIYKNAGVVRDIPELEVTMANKHRGMHAEYNSRVYKMDQPFTTEKKHWLVLGNSYGRDFVNVILESPIAEDVEVSYVTIPEYKDSKYKEHFASADKVWLSTLGLSEDLVTEVEVTCLANGLTPEDLVIVGEKNFGASNGQIYAKRNQPDYFQQTVKMEPGFAEKNERLKSIYGERYLDLISFVDKEEGRVRVFSDDNMYISADCGHLTHGGACFYGKLIDWNKYLK